MFINILVIVLLSAVLWMVLQKNQSNFRPLLWRTGRRFRERFYRIIKINKWGATYLDGIIADIRRINSLPEVIAKYQNQMDNIMKWKRRGIYFNRRRETLQNVINQAQNAPSIEALVEALQGKVYQQKKAVQVAKTTMVKKITQIKRKIARKAAAVRKAAVKRAGPGRAGPGRAGKHGMKASNKHGNYYFYFNS